MLATYFQFVIRDQIIVIRDQITSIRDDLPIN